MTDPGASLTTARDIEATPARLPRSSNGESTRLVDQLVADVSGDT